MLRGIMRTPTVVPMVLVVLFVFPTGVVLAQAPSMSGNIFFFHLRSEIYRSENASAIVLDEANLTAPTNSTGRVLQVAAAIQNATTFVGPIWVGTVVWVTEPLIEPVVIQGTASFTVWLSSDDAAPFVSGVGAGVAVLNEQNQTVGNYIYTFTYAYGKVLTSIPSPYTFNVQVNRNVSPGQRLVFATGVGSTTEGWHMNVFFDGVQYQSRVQLPEDITVIPEFKRSAAAGLTMFLAIVLTLTVLRRIGCEKKTRNVAPLRSSNQWSRPATYIE